MKNYKITELPALSLFDDPDNKHSYSVCAATAHINDQMLVQVSLPSGDSWMIGSVSVDAPTDLFIYGSWTHVSGFTTKQPKRFVQDKIMDFLRSRESVLEELLPSLHREYMNLYGFMFEENDGESLAAENAALREDLAAAKEENEQLRNDKSPSFDALVLNTLIGELKPAIQQQAQILANEVIEKGSLPTRLVVEVANKTSEMEGVFNERFTDVLALVANRIPVYLSGEAGTGKNYLGEQVAEALGLPFVYMGQVMDKYTDCVGFVDANGVEHATPLVNAVRHGGVLFIDEIDASIPEVLITCNALLANGYMVTGWGERIDAHDDFRVICAGNTVGTGADATYNGRYQLDGASLDRFAMVGIDYDPRVELQLAGGDEELCSFVQALRASVRHLNLAFPVSYRATSRMHTMDAAGMTLYLVLEMCLLKSLAFEERRVVCKHMREADRRLFDKNRFAIAFDAMLDR